MLLENGFIKWRIKEGGGYDDNGMPIPVEEKWSEPIPVHVRQGYRNEIKETAYYDNAQTYAKYELVLDYNYWGYIPSGRVHLIFEGHDIGECYIITKQPLINVQRVRLVLHSIEDKSKTWK